MSRAVVGELALAKVNYCTDDNRMICYDDHDNDIDDMSSFIQMGTYA